MAQTIDTNVAVKQKHSFAYGWGLQVLVGIMFFFYAGLCTDGQNVAIPAFANAHGWTYGTLLALSTPAGWIGMIGIVLFSHLVDKKGSRYVIVFSMIASGIVCFFYGFATNIVMYAIAYFLLVLFTNGYGNVATGALTASWFPRRRGYALGWSSMGMPVATAIYVPMLAVLIGSFGIGIAMSIIGSIIIIIGIIAIFWVKNTPEELGLAPDNDECGLEELEQNRKEMDAYRSDWTIKRLLTTKIVWLQSICYGLLFLTTIGLVSQMVPRLMFLGHSETFALSMLSLAAVVGMVGSVVWGIIDMKIGTRKATLFYAVWYAAAVIVLLLTKHNMAGTVIGICMSGWGLGGIGNLQPSMLAQTFGRFDYASASRVVNTIVAFVRVMAFAVVGIAINVTGSIDGAYGFLIASCVVAFILAFIMDDRLVGKKG